MTYFYMGDIMLFPTVWAPEGFLPCDGRQLDTNKYQALFSLIGNMYGGDLKTYFNLPDFRGRAPVCASPEFPNGSKAGQEKNTLTLDNLPGHTHDVSEDIFLHFEASADPATLHRPYDGCYLAKTTNSANKFVKLYSDPGAYTDIKLEAETTDIVFTDTPSGQKKPQSYSNMQPFLAVGFYICVDGIYPPRS